MSVHMAQVTATTTPAVKLGTVPNGVSSVVITNDGNAAVLLGNTNAVSNTNGLAIPPNTSIRFDTFAASRGTDLYVIVATGGSSQPVSILISTTD